MFSPTNKKTDKKRQRICCLGICAGADRNGGLGFRLIDSHGILKARYFSNLVVLSLVSTVSDWWQYKPMRRELNFLQMSWI